MDDDDRFLSPVADALATLPAVRAVTLGGSRAQGTHRPDSDWDLAVYYRGDFRPEALRDLVRDLGWQGEVSEIGGWGRGVFNGGAWLRIDGRPVDVHYRDLDVVERELARAGRGELVVEPLMFHLAGIPTYLVVGELALGRVLRGSLPRPEYPAALRRNAPAQWAGRAELTLQYAEVVAHQGRVAQCAGLVATAAMQYAHAVLAARGQWPTNEKSLLDRAGLRGVDAAVAAMADDPESLVRAVHTVRSLGSAAVSS